MYAARRPRLLFELCSTPFWSADQADVGKQYDGYNGGKDCTHVEWTNAEAMENFHQRTYELNRAYEGPSMMVMKFRNVDNSDPWPSPIVFHDTSMNGMEDGSNYIDGEHQHQVFLYDCLVCSFFFFGKVIGIYPNYARRSSARASASSTGPTTRRTTRTT
jgi:hypothetical protein